MLIPDETDRNQHSNFPSVVWAIDRDLVCVGGRFGDFVCLVHGDKGILVLIVLSPAKTLDFESPLPTRKHSVPAMVGESEQLIEVLATKTPAQIAKLMNLSDKLADLNVERYRTWEPTFTPDQARPAVLAFKGDVYMGMEIERYGERDFTQAQKSLRILSGLHGLLRPLDLIHPYRLEMGTDLKNPRGKNLYEFWGDRITDAINADLADHKPKVLVNLASQEYFGAVQPARVDGRIVSPVFLDEKNGKQKIISFFAKRARGSMASWLILNRVKSLKGLTEFDGMGYAYDPELSTENSPTFTRGEQ